MAKEILRGAGLAAIQKTLETFLPDIRENLSHLQSQVNEFRREVELRFHQVDEKLHDLEQRHRELISDLGIKINTVDTRVASFINFLGRDTSKMDGIIERLVRLEESQKTKRRKAG